MAATEGERYAFHVGADLEPDDDATDPGPCGCSECRAKLRLRERLATAHVQRFIRVEAPLAGGPAWTVYLQREDAATSKGTGDTEEAAIDAALHELEGK